MRWIAVAAVNLSIFCGLFAAAEISMRAAVCESLACAQEIYTRAFPGEGQVRPLHRGFLPDPDLGWLLNPNFTPPRAAPAPRWSRDYRVNQEGFRNDEDFTVAAARAGPPRIMVLGDSFVFGTGLERDGTLARILERRLGGRYRVYNAGVSGWGIDQMVLAYKKFAPVLRPHIVLLVFIDADFDRALHAFRADAGAKPMLMYRDGEFVRRRTGPPLYERVARRSLILNRLYLGAWIHPQERRLHHALFSDLIRSTRGRGERLIVLRYPDYAGARKGTREERHDFSELFREHSVPYYDPYDTMLEVGEHIYYEFYQSDSHPSRRGNEGIAKYMIESGFPDG